MRIHKWSAAVIAAGTFAMAHLATAPTASATSTAIDACVTGPTLAAIVYRVPVGVTVTVDIDPCGQEGAPWTSAGAVLTHGAGIVNVMLPSGDDFADLIVNDPTTRDGGYDVLLYPCTASTVNGLRLPDHNYTPGGGDDRWWAPIFDAAVDLCSLTNPTSSAWAGGPTWLQAYARSSDATCESGWSPGWDMWPNGGTGGPVCNREIYFDWTSGTWGIR